MKFSEMTQAQIERVADEIRDLVKKKTKWSFEDGTNVGEAFAAVADHLLGEAKRRGGEPAAPTTSPGGNSGGVVARNARETALGPVV